MLNTPPPSPLWLSSTNLQYAVEAASCDHFGIDWKWWNSFFWGHFGFHSSGCTKSLNDAPIYNIQFTSILMELRTISNTNDFERENTNSFYYSHLVVQFWYKFTRVPNGWGSLLDMAQSKAQKRGLGSIPSNRFSEDGFSGKSHLPSLCDSFDLKSTCAT